MTLRLHDLKLRLLGGVAIALVSALLVPQPALALPAVVAEAPAVEDGSLVWGLKESFRNYIEFGAAHGSIAVTDGASRTADGLLSFPVMAADYDSETEVTDVRFGGHAVFTGHGGALHLDFQNVRVLISPQGSGLFADLYRRDIAGGWVTEKGVRLANLDHAAGTFVHDEPAGRSTWSSIPASLAASGAPAFAGFYSAGLSLDPVSFSYHGPGSSPKPETENWVQPGQVKYKEAEARDADWSPRLLTADGDHLIGVGPGGRSIVVADPITLQEHKRIELPEGSEFEVEPNTGVIFSVERSPADGDGQPPTRIVRLETDGEGNGRDVIFTTSEDIGTIQSAGRSRDGRFVLTFTAPGFVVHRLSEEADGTWQLVGRALTDWYPDTAVPEERDGDPQAILRAVDVRSFAAGSGDLIVAPSRTTWTRDNPKAPYKSTTDPLPLRVLDIETGKGGEIANTVSPLGNGWTAGVPMPDGGFWATASINPSQFLRVRPSSDGGYEVKDAQVSVPFVATLSSADASSADGGLLLGQPGRKETWRDGSLRATIDVAGFASGHLLGPNDQVWWADDGKVRRYEPTLIAPSLTSQPTDATATFDVGDETATVTFAVGVTGAPEPNVRWQTRAAGATSIRDWVDVPDATEPTLHSTVTIADAYREYRAIVQNEVGALATDVARVQVHSAPEAIVPPADASVGEGRSATFTVMHTGTPSASVTWEYQRAAGGDWSVATALANAKIDGATLTLNPVRTDQDGFRFRAVLANAVATVRSAPAGLHVVRAPDEPTTYKGVALEWSGSSILQHKPPQGAAYSFSAGVSDGTRATYAAEGAGVTVLQRAADGTDTVATWETRAAHTKNGGSQLVRAAEGTAVVQPDGSAVVTWPATFSVNTYDGLVPFTLKDLRFEVEANGTGTLTADLSGYSGDMSDPDKPKEPTAPVEDVTIATFHGAVVDTAGTVRVVPDYAGVEVSTPADAVAQKREGDGWGSWPQGFVDFHQTTGLASYFYSSGGSFDPDKAPLPFSIGFANAAPEPHPVAPTVTQQPQSVSVTAGEDAPFIAAATGIPAPSVRWQSRLANAGDWVDVPGATAATYTAADVPAGASGTQYRAVFANSAGEAVTDVATLTVTTAVPNPEPSAPNPQPSSPGGGGLPGSAAPSASQLTDATRGGISAPATAVVGSTITVTVGVDHAGHRVHAYLFSEPVDLGVHTVSVSGTIGVTLPRDITGSHRLAVYAEDGSLIGWTPITITLADGTLPSTGAGAPLGALPAALAGLLLGAVLLVAARARSRRLPRG